jgi:arylsulfatase A-like enzyme
MLDFAGLEIPNRVQGVSLKPLVEQGEDDDWRDSFFYEHWFTAGGEIVPSEGMRTVRWKYCRYLVPGQEAEGVARWEELFDLSVDPHETVNLAADPRYAEQLAAMRQGWAVWREKAK